MKAVRLLNPALVFLFVVCFANNLLAQQEKAFVFFGLNETTLSSEAKSSIDLFISSNDIKKGCNVIIGGHTDVTGSVSGNERLSGERANAVAQYFEMKGISKSQIEVHSYAAAKPVAGNKTTNGRARNRRAEIILSCGSGTYEVEKKQPMAESHKQPKAENQVANNDVSSGKPFQVFKANASNEIKIKGKEGSEIVIPVKTLETSNHKPATGEIEIRMTEYYKMSDILRAGLTTMTDYSIIESKGMVYIEAYMNGEKLQVMKNKFIYAKIVGANTKDGDMIFNGVTENTNKLLVSEKLEPKIKSDKRVNKNNSVFTDRAMGDTTTCPVGSQNMTWSLSPLAVDGTSSDTWFQKSTKLEWINCDHFYRSNEKLIDVNAQVTGITDTINVYMIFKGMRLITRGYWAGSGFNFPNVLKGKEVIIVAINKNKKDIKFGKLDTTVSNNYTNFTVNLAPITETDFSNELDRLNW